MAVKHDTRAHAVLSASASKRWMSCPPSAMLCAEIPDVETDYAREGTLAHELAEWKVNKLLGSNEPNHSALAIRAAILALCAYHSNSNALQWDDEGRNHTGGGRCGYGETQVLEAHIRKARLYDIRNAGRHHRFTVSGKLVHNCGYGGSVGAMKAMGADDMGLTDDEREILEFREERRYGRNGALL